MSLAGRPRDAHRKITVNNHAKAVQAVKWLHDNYPTTSYTGSAHVERKQPLKGGYTVSDFRDFNNAAPDVAFGFESMPGHRKEEGARRIFDFCRR